MYVFVSSKPHVVGCFSFTLVFEECGKCKLTSDELLAFTSARGFANNKPKRVYSGLTVCLFVVFRNFYKNREKIFIYKNNIFMWVLNESKFYDSNTFNGQFIENLFDKDYV